MFSLNVKVMINKVHGTQIWLPYFNMQINQYANLHVPYFNLEINMFLQHANQRVPHSICKYMCSSLQHPNQRVPHFNIQINQCTLTFLDLMLSKFSSFNYSLCTKN